MHTPASLGLMDVVEPSVRRYLEGQVRQAQQQAGESDVSLTDNGLSISHTLSSLRLKLVSVLQAALVALPNQE
jgi:molybdenum cofactor biosynthesis enzyme MoaA